jgi:hypothetical protein
MPPPIETPNSLPTPVPGAVWIGANWERAALDRDWRPNDLARGPNGWVAGGDARCRVPGCGRALAATWFSTDGLTWNGGPVPEGRRAVIGTVASDGERWFAAGVADSGIGEDFRRKVVIWRSPDGQTWTPVGSIPLGLPEKGIGPIGELAAGPGGVILSWVDPGDPEARTVYWSENGEEWEPVEKETFGLQRGAYLQVNTVKVVDGRFVMVLNCECGTVWSSSDGRKWRADATLGPAFGADVASDERVLVVLLDDDEECDCRVRVITLPNGRTGWTVASEVLPFGDPLATYAGDTFIATGWTEPPDDLQQSAHVFTSPDGRNWTEFVPAPFRMNDCYATSLEGADDRAILLGRDGCAGIWVSLAPGAG